MISVTMATYNGKAYVKEQIDSILAQTIQEFELVVCDDYSTDNTYQILEKYAAKDSRIKIFRNDFNLGFKKNFEKAISLCTGEYIALCDQDDIWLPNHLELLKRNLEGYSLSCGNMEVIDLNGNSLGTTWDKECHFYYTEGNYLYMLLLRGNKFQGASMMMKRDFVKKLLPISDAIKYHDIWFAVCACMEQGLHYTTDVITKYRVHGNNVSNPSRLKFLKKLLKDFVKSDVETESFALYRELKKIYGTENKNLYDIGKVLSHIENKKLSFKDIKFLWEHYYDIGGKKTHLDFIPALLVWNAWKEISE